MTAREQRNDSPENRYTDFKLPVVSPDDADCMSDTGTEPYKYLDHLSDLMGNLHFINPSLPEAEIDAIRKELYRRRILAQRLEEDRIVVLQVDADYHEVGSSRLLVDTHSKGRAARPGLNGLAAPVLNSICPPLIKSP